MDFELIITHIDYHLINFTYINLLNGWMARHFTQNPAISSTNNQNLKKEDMISELKN